MTGEAFWNPTSGGGASGVSDFATAIVVTVETTSSTTFTDLATAGPSVTVTVGASGAVLLAFGANMEQSSTNRAEMGYSVDGGAVDNNDTASVEGSAGESVMSMRTTLVTGLSEGDHTFTCKYRTSGAGTGEWFRRRITAIAL